MLSAAEFARKLDEPRNHTKQHEPSGLFLLRAVSCDFVVTTSSHNYNPASAARCRHSAHQLQFPTHHRGAPEIFSRREILTTNDRALIRYTTRKTSHESDLGRAGRRLRGDDSGHDLLRPCRRR